MNPNPMAINNEYMGLSSVQITIIIHHFYQRYLSLSIISSSSLSLEINAKGWQDGLWSDENIEIDMGKKLNEIWKIKKKID